MLAPVPAAELHALDHVVVAVRDLEAATRQTASLLGRQPSWCGEHPDAGTVNALFQLANTYLELLAARGEGPVGAGLEARLREHGEGVFALAFASDDAAGFGERLRGVGLEPGEPQAGRGVDSARGVERLWTTVLVPPAATRGVPLFAIEHRQGALESVEPEGNPAAAVEALDHVVLLSGDLEGSRRLYGEQLGLRLALDRTFDARGQRILFFRVGGATVEVVGAAEPPDEPGPDRAWGLAWKVADIEAARARLEQAGFDVSGIRPGAKPGTAVCTVRGEPLGVATLLIGPGLPGPPGLAGEPAASLR
jgi:catechol 2,3-dioxygenase-like lactoylglutathione lyase family enzyme